MSHMQAQVVGPQDWWEVETSQGTFWVQCEDVGRKDITAHELLVYLPVIDTGAITRWEFKSGYGARLSASGYLDCTEWCVFDTDRDAREHLYSCWDVCPACLDSRQDGTPCKCVQEIGGDEWVEAVVEMACEKMTMAEVVHEAYDAISEMLNNDVIEMLGERAIEKWRDSVKANTKG